MLQVSAQDLTSLKNSALSSGNSMIESLAADQVKSLTKKLNLNESQQEQVSSLVVSQLKSEKFQKMLGSLSPNSLMGSKDSGAQTDKIQNALMEDQEFQKSLSSVLDDEQKENLKASQKKR
jgi:hypothetical protein